MTTMDENPYQSPQTETPVQSRLRPHWLRHGFILMLMFAVAGTLPGGCWAVWVVCTVREPTTDMGDAAGLMIIGSAFGGLIGFLGIVWDVVSYLWSGNVNDT